MKLESVKIKNFRIFKDETIYFNDYNCPNGSGIGGIESSKVMENTSTEENTEFSEEQIKIMKRLAMIKESGRNDMGEINFARLLRMKVVILQYHIELLVDEKYIYKMFMVGGPSQ